MPRTIDGKKLTKHEDEIWKSVFDKTGSGAIATAAVQKERKRRAKKKKK